jgi:DNA replicative helicase MCM subunit Mcm2 (Cdc46/Mcm family)
MIPCSPDKMVFLTISFDDSESCHTQCTPFSTVCSNLYFKPLTDDIPIAVREVRGSFLGRLITVRGIVTRVSEVKPLLQVNAYTCDVCGSETFQDISQKTFQPILDCQNDNECKKNGVTGSLHMQTRACRFSPFQEIKIQEMVCCSHYHRIQTF